MTAHSLRDAVLASLLALAVPAAAADSVDLDAVSPAARRAAAAVDAFHSALRAGDRRAALALLAEDALIFEQGRAERSKAEYAAHHLGDDSAFSRAVPGEKLRRRGDAAGDFAWIATEGRSRGRYRDTDIDRVTDETMVLRRAKGAWRIVHIHWSSAEASVD